MPIVDVVCTACGHCEEDAFVQDAQNIECPECSQVLPVTVYASAGLHGILFTPQESTQLDQTFTSNKQKRDWMQNNNVREMEDSESKLQTYRSNEAADWQARRNGYTSRGQEKEARDNKTFKVSREKLSCPERGPGSMRKREKFIKKSKALKTETFERLSNLPQFRS